MSDTDVLNAVTKMLEEGVSQLGETVSRDFEDQLRSHRHLDEGTPERAYWHAGYVAAMKSVLASIKSRAARWPAPEDV